MIETTTITMIETRVDGVSDTYRAFVEGDDYQWYLDYIEGQGRTAYISTRTVGDCPCGESLELSEFTITNECEECGRLYNMAGQELRPPNEWKED